MKNEPNNVKTAEEMIREAQERREEELQATKKKIEEIKKERPPS